MEKICKNCYLREGFFCTRFEDQIELDDFCSYFQSQKSETGVKNKAKKICENCHYQDEFFCNRFNSYIHLHDFCSYFQSKELKVKGVCKNCCYRDELFCPWIYTGFVRESDNHCKHFQLKENKECNKDSN